MIHSSITIRKNGEVINAFQLADWSQHESFQQWIGSQTSIQWMISLQAFPCGDLLIVYLCKISVSNMWVVLDIEILHRRPLANPYGLLGQCPHCLFASIQGCKAPKTTTPTNHNIFWLAHFIPSLSFLFLFVGVGSIQSKVVVSDFQIDDESRLQDSPPPSSQSPSSARCCPIHQDRIQ